MYRFKYNPVALKSVLLPSLLEDDQLLARSKKRQRLGIDDVSTVPNAPEEDSEYGVVLETSKERFLVVRHGKNSQSGSMGGTNRVSSDKSMFTISLIQGEVEVTGGLPASTTVPTTRLEDFTPVPEEPKSPLPAPEQPTKEPSPVEPLPPISTPQEVKQVVQDLERGRSTSVVDMELDTPASVTPTATMDPDIPDPEKASSSGRESGQVAVQQNTKKAYGSKLQPKDNAPPVENVPAKVEPPSTPASVTTSEPVHAEVPLVTSAPVPRPEPQVPPQVKLKLQILQRNIHGDDLVFGDDGLGILSADVDPLDNAKKGWLIEAPRWRRHDGRILDCIVVS